MGEPPTIVSNGWFTMESWEHDQSMTLVRNENFHGTKPLLSGIEYTIFQDPPTQGLTALRRRMSIWLKSLWRTLISLTAIQR